MGAWGLGPFDNDDAADWLGTLSDVSDLSSLRIALRLRWFDYLYLQAPKGCVIVAASEVLASALGRESPDLPVSAKNWVKLNSRLPYKSLVNTAHIALQRVLGRRSELRELWNENPPARMEWQEQMQALLHRIRV
jgi:hypothetical protein